MKKPWFSRRVSFSVDAVGLSTRSDGKRQTVCHRNVPRQADAGLQQPVNLNAPFPTSWGQMIQDGQKSYRNQSWILIAPSVAVALITLSFTFVGDGLRDALDPRENA